MNKKEESIENEILSWLTIQHKILAWKNDIKGFYNQNKWFYQRNKSSFIIRWISDIWAIIEWKYIAIEVKKPSEMKFFDKSLKELQEQFIKAQTRNLSATRLKTYNHAIEQRQYLDDVIKNWWVWFFTSSIEQTSDRLKENWYIIN